MNIKSQWAGACFMLCLAVSAQAVDISGTVFLGGATGPVTAKIAVSTVPINDPAQALDFSHILASGTVTIPSVSAGFSFTGLPFFGNPTEYYVYAFEDINADGVLDPTEIMGGYGPFPDHQPSAHVTAVASTDVLGPTFTITPRAEIQGVVDNLSAQPGERLIVWAVETLGNMDLNQKMELTLGGGLRPFSLPGLKLGHDYNVEAFVDTQLSGMPGAYMPDPFEDKTQTGPFTLSVSTILNISTLTITGGAVGGSTPDHIRLEGPNGSWNQVISSGAASGDMVVSVRDFNDLLTSTPTPTVIQFSAYDSLGLVSLLEISTDNFTSLMATPTLTIPGGQPFSQKLRFRYRGTGYVTLQAQAIDFPILLDSRFSYQSFYVLPTGSAFTNLNARTTSDVATVMGTSITITPDWDGANDGAVLSCDPPDPSVNWELVISSEAGFTTGVVSRNYGSGPGQAYWYGTGFDGRPVPIGLYYARFQTEGAGIVSSTLTVTVNSAYIKGVVVDGVPSPVVDAEVRVFGQKGGGYARTATDGSFFVGGLASTQTYTVEISHPGQTTKTFSVVTSSDMGTIALSPGGTLHVLVTVTSTSTMPSYGSVFVHDAAYTSTVYAPLHLDTGALTTDNGLPSSDPNFSTFTVVGVDPSLTYTVDIQLPQFGHVSLPGITAGAGVTVDVSTTMARKANIFGQVAFPAALNTPFGGEWVSVDAVPTSPAGSPPVAWGGGYVNNGASTGTYQLFGVDPGTYTLRAFTRGYVTSSTSPIVVSNVDLSSIDFSAFSLGGTATGTITINGDTSQWGSSGFGGFGCGVGQVGLPLNAFNPSDFTSAFTQICVSTTAAPVTVTTYTLTGLTDGTYNLFTFLPGFQLNPPGPQVLTVSGGTGSKDIVLDALSGRVNIVATLSGGEDPSLVVYRLERDGPDQNQRQGALSGVLGGPGVASEQKLGTGLYRLTLMDGNPGKGLMQTVGVSVANGKVSTATVDMTIPTYQVSGTVSIQGNLILPSTWSVTVSSMSGLTAVGVLPVVQVYSFPLPNHFEGNLQPLRTVPVTPWASSATFSLAGLPQGGYFLRVNEDLTPPPTCANCGFQPGLPEMAEAGQVVYIGTATVTGVNLTLTNGVALTGTVQRPVGDTSTEARQFTLRLHRADNLSQWETTVNTSGLGSANYTIPHLAPGDYVLEVYENSLPVKYAAPALNIKIAKGDVSQDVQLVAAATIVGRLRDADTGTLITSQNVGQFLPDAFEISSQANPWVPGGYARAERNNSGPGPMLDPNTGQFIITRLIPDTTYDVSFRGYQNMGFESLAQGQRTYAPTVVSGIQLAANQVYDMGTVDLNQGSVLTGTIRNATGVPLPNIRVIGVPSLSNGPDRHTYVVEAYTDESGRYEIHGVDRNQRYYDVIAAPRFENGNLFGQLSGTKYAEERLRMIDVNTPAKMTGLDFVLTPATGILIGTVKTADGGVLVPAFEHGNNQSGQRGADLVLHLDNTPLDQNPLGEIEERTSPDGSINVGGLKPGIYTVRVISRGYGTAIKKVNIASSGNTNLGTVTLGLGATVSGAITKPDGSSPSATDVNMVVGVDDNFEDFVFGTIDTNDETQLVTGYALSGFQTGKNYGLLFITKKDEILQAATDIQFTTTTESRTIDLVFRAAPPKIFVNQEHTGNQYTLRFFSSQPFRNLKDTDNDLSQIVTVSTGAGVIVASATTLSPSRDFLTVTYDAPPTETSFSLRLKYYSTVVDPDSATGDNFLFDKTFDFYAGIGRRRSSSIPNVTGGDCDLEGVATGVDFGAGAFDVDKSSTIEVGIQEATDLAQLPVTAAPSLAKARAVRRAQVFGDMARRLGPSGYPSMELYKAISAAPSVSPFSSFYDIFLPAGVNHMLKDEALLTLKYDDSITDPSTINIYYFDPANNVFLLEKSQRTVDEVNKTITVGVRHLSTFVVLQSQALVIGTNNYTGQEIFVHNVPNPFNLQSKTVTLTHTSPTQDQTTEGTLIAYGLPSGKSGTVTVEIFDVSGALVRTLTATGSTAGSYHYLEWDGRNDGGSKVASGVYIARFTLDGGDEKFFKMAVIK